MKTRMSVRAALGTALLLGSAACGGTAAETAATARPREFTVPFYNAQGTEVATATLTQDGQNVRVRVNTTRVPAGTHGTHFHAVGRCDAPDFTTAGPHLNPTGAQHGMRNPRGPHLGDLPNLTVGSNGQGTLEATAAGSLTAGTAPFFDADGTALVIHANADDQVTDPSGNSGARIACAVIASPVTGS